MKYGKRQLIMASLILALGAAVYLNWQFAGTEIPKEEPSGTAESGADEYSALGAAQLVNSAYVETVSDDLSGMPEYESTPTSGSLSESVPAAAGEEALSEARLSRQTARDQAVELLQDLLGDEEAESAVKEAAVSEASMIAQNILKETNIESLVEAKGFSGCVAYINEGSCTVVVNGDISDEQNALIIRDIAVSETGFAPEQIKIVPAA